MEQLNILILVIRTVIIPAGVVLRVIIILIKMMYEDEGNTMYKKKLINTILFGILAELIYVIYEILKYYYERG